ncbi:MAG: hypothetical protein AAF466_05750 [Bacteroidota bacterium]
MKHSIIIYMMLLLVPLGCARQENTNENEGSSIDLDISLSATEASRQATSALDFSSFGNSHDAAMDYVAAMPGFATASLQQIYNYVNSYSDSVTAPGNCGCDTWQDQANHMNEIEFMVEHPAHASTALVSMGMIDPEDMALTDQFFAILDNAASYPNMTYQSVEEFTTEVELFESYILANHPVVYDPVVKTGNHAAVLLGACAIVKNSYAYWIDAATNTSHPWHDRVVNQTFFGANSATVAGSTNLERGIFGDIWRGIKRAFVDAAGFVVGGNCGGILDKNGRDVGCAVRHAGRKSSGVR